MLNNKIKIFLNWRFLGNLNKNKALLYFYFISKHGFAVAGHTLSIMDELYSVIEAIQTRLSATTGDIKSVSATTNYLIYLGAKHLQGTPAFTDLNVPNFDIDGTTRKPKVEKEASPVPPEEKEAPEATQTPEKIPIPIPDFVMTEEEAANIFKSIPNNDMIPSASAQILKLWIRRGVKVEDYDGLFTFDMVSIKEKHEMKTTGYKWSPKIS
jgi:hypothetical protein